MTKHPPYRLAEAVAAIYPDIKSRTLSTRNFEERYLWWELSCCILSSQVPYALAMAAANAIDRNLLLADRLKSHPRLEERLRNTLQQPLQVDGSLRAYRFPTARASQLARTRMLVSETGGTLQDLLQQFSGVAEARTWLVQNAPGFGPKQASMFLRNIGFSYDLAILDRHVLDYMSVLGLYSGKDLFVSSLTQYQQHERKLRDHAEKLDCQIGLLDWAIWIVMRVAKREGLIPA